MSVETAELQKAVASLARALELEETDVHRDATIQRFEFCIELAWKTSKKIMGTATTAPKQVVREMAQNKLIEDPVLWLQAIDQRNLTSHTYKEEIAIQVYRFVQTFYPEFERLVKKLT